MPPLLSVHTLLSRLYISGQGDHAVALARTLTEIRNLPQVPSGTWHK